MAVDPMDQRSGEVQSEHASTGRRTKVLVALGVLAVFATIALAVLQPWKLFVDKVVDEPVPIALGAARQPAATVAPTTASPTPSSTVAPSAASTQPTQPTASPAPAPPTPAIFVSKNHPTSGKALYLASGDQRFVRFEDFETDNGPDVVVYLSTRDVSVDDVGTDYLDLGELKGNVGNQNYAIPAGVDLSKYKSVVVWCRRFSVAFGAAPFSAV